MTRPYVLLSVAMSVDGHIDDAGPDRLLLSNEQDFDRVDQVRAGVDAILIGAEALRRDNPRLIVKSATRRAARVAAGKAATPIKVTVTRSGDLDASARFWQDDVVTLVYTVDTAAARLAARLGADAEVVPLGAEVDFAKLLDDLGRRGVERLMVEGGATVHTALLSAGLADELQLAVAPVVVGDAAAPRLLNPAVYPPGRMRLAEVTRLGDVAVLRYFPNDHRYWMRRAIGRAALCPPSRDAFSVGAVIVGSDGTELSTGFSRETDDKVHAEESALAKLDRGDPRLAGATLYSTLEPCSQRGTPGRTPCTDLVLEAGIRTVVIAWREPATFVADCVGVERLREHGVTVIELVDLAAEASAANRHLDLS